MVDSKVVKPQAGERSSTASAADARREFPLPATDNSLVNCADALPAAPAAVQPELVQSENLALFPLEGDEDMFLGLPLESYTVAAQDVTYYGTGNEHNIEALAADLFFHGEGSMDLLLGTLSQGQDAANAVPLDSVDVAPNLPQADTMAEATALVATKIVLENNG